MAACTTCGFQIDSSAQFCSACGVRAPSDAPSDQRTTALPIELLSATAGDSAPARIVTKPDSIASTSTVSTGTSPRRTGVAIGVLLVGAALIWSIASSGNENSEDAVSPAPTATPSEGHADDLDNGSEPSPEGASDPEKSTETTWVFRTTDQTTTEIADEIGSAATGLSSDEPERNRIRFQDIASTNGGSNQTLPALNWTVFVTTNFGRSDFLNLSTGEQHTLREPSVAGDVWHDLVHVSETHVVWLVTAWDETTELQSATLEIALLDDPDAERIVIGPAASFSVERSNRPDQVWISRSFENDRLSSYELIDLDSGAALKALALQPGQGPVRGADGTMISVAGGGTYKVDDGTPRRFSTGQALAATEDAVLLVECDDSMACITLWRARLTGVRTALPVPPALSSMTYGVVEGDGRWIVIGKASYPLLVEIATGRTIEITDATPWTQVGVSPDGLWVGYAASDQGLLTLLNLETEESIVVNDISGIESVRFVSLDVIDALTTD